MVRALAPALSLIAACSAREGPLPCGGAGAEEACEQRRYRELRGAVRNPERGFFAVADIFDDEDVRWAARTGATLVNVRLRIDDFRDAPLAAEYLAELEAGFARLRGAGLKGIVRFRYNDGSGEDAPLEQVLDHIDQVAPILAANADVIAVMQAGFIGAWGEWHGSTSGLDTDGARGAIASALLAALPAERAIQIRYPHMKERLFPGGPLEDADALSGSDRARVGHHNDCLLASPSDEGTYVEPIEEWRAYVARDSRFVPVGGEACIDSSRLSCERTLAELEAMHWSYLNDSYPEAVLSRWRLGGCYEEIERRLGYRLVLVRASFGAAPRAGGSLPVAVEIINRGFAAPLGPREVVFVLEGSAGRHEYPVDLARSGADPRRWPPGDPLVVRHELPLAGVAPGTYRLALWLPDGFASLRDDPAYAVRLANEDTWDPATGDNVLVPELDVLP